MNTSKYMLKLLYMLAAMVGISKGQQVPKGSAGNVEENKVVREK